MNDFTPAKENNNRSASESQILMQMLSKKYSTWSQRVQKILIKERLVGMYDFSEAEYSEMVALLQCWYTIPTSLFESYITINDDFRLYVFVTLVEITKRWKIQNDTDENDEETAFWPFVIKTLSQGKESENSNFYRRITNLLNNLMSEEKWFFVAPVRSKYYGTLMMHALAPQDSMYSFFDLCFNVYKNDLDYGYSSDDKYICDIVAAEVSRVLNRDTYKEEKKVSIGSSAYSIKIGLKSFISHPKLQNDFKNFIDGTLLKIDKLYYSHDFSTSNRVNTLIHEWWMKKVTSEEIPSRQNLRRETVSKQNISLTYRIVQNRACLCIPSIRLDDAQDKIIVSIKVGHICQEEILNTWRGEFTIKSKATDYDLDKLLAKSSETQIDIRVCITVNDELVYDSRESLNREFILFESDKEIQKPFNKPSNYIVYCKDIDSLTELPEEIHEISNNVFNIYPNPGERIGGKNQRYYFSDVDQIEKSKDHIALLGFLNDVKWIDSNGTSFSIVTNDFFLTIPEKYNLNGLEIRCNSNRKILSQLIYKSLPNGVRVFNLIEQEIVPPEIPISLQIFSNDQSRIQSDANIIFIPRFNIEFDKKYYFGDENKTVLFSSESSSETLTWNHQNKEIQLPIYGGHLSIIVPFLKWRIGHKDWQVGPLKGRKWYKDIINDGDKLEVCLPQQQLDYTLLVKTDGSSIQEKIENNRDYPIGRLIYSWKNEDKISIFLIADDKKCNKRKRYDLLTVSKNPHFSSNPIVYDGGKLYWNVENTYVGEKKHDFFAIIKQNNKNQYRLTLSDKNRELNEIRIVEGFYTVIIKLKESNVFCSATKYVEIFRESNFKIGNPNKNRFSGKQLQINSIWLQDGEKIQLKTIKYSVRELSYHEKNGISYFLGHLYIGENRIDKMINEKRELESINPVRLELDDNHSFWMVAGWKDDYDFIEGLYYDFAKRCLCNTAIDSPDYKPIEKYEYNLIELC